MKKITSIICLLFSFTLLAQANDTLLRMKLSGHKSNLETVLFAPNGKWVATGGTDKTINLYMCDTPNFGAKIFSFEGHFATVNALAFSRNSKFLISGGKDFMVMVWDAETATSLQKFSGHTDIVTAVCMDAGMRLVFSSSLDGTIRMYDMKEPLKSRTIKYDAPINDFILTPDNRFILAALQNGKIVKTDLMGKVLLTLTGHAGSVNCIDLSINKTTLVSGSDDKTIKIWDLTNGKEVKTLSGHGWKVTSLELSKNGKYLASGCNDGETKLWDMESYNNMQTYASMGNNVRCVSFATNLTMIVSASYMDATNFGALLWNTGLTLPPPPVRKPTPNTPKPTPKGSTPTPKK